MHAHFVGWDGKRDGDPAKLARNLIRVLQDNEPPVRLLLSKSAYPAVDAYYVKRYAGFQKGRKVTVDTDFEK